MQCTLCTSTTLAQAALHGCLLHTFGAANEVSARCASVLTLSSDALPHMESPWKISGSGGSSRPRSLGTVCSSDWGPSTTMCPERCRCPAISFSRSSSFHGRPAHKQHVCKVSVASVMTHA